jgi:hypothetical protein
MDWVPYLFMAAGAFAAQALASLSAEDYCLPARASDWRCMSSGRDSGAGLRMAGPVLFHFGLCSAITRARLRSRMRAASEWRS